MPVFRRLIRWALFALAGVAFFASLALSSMYLVMVPKLPDVETLRNVEMQEPMYVYSRDGHVKGPWRRRGTRGKRALLGKTARKWLPACEKSVI